VNLKKNLIRIFIFLTMVTIFTGCSSDSNSAFVDQFLNDSQFNTNLKSSIFQGQVLYNSIPVENAIIYLKDANDDIRLDKKTDSNGFFYILNEDMGTKITKRRYTLEIIAAGFNLEKENIDLRIEKEKTYIIEPKEGFFTGSFSSAVSGKVIDSYTLNPVDEVLINVKGNSFVSNKEGEFLIGKDLIEVATFSKTNYRAIVANFQNESVFVNKIIALDPVMAGIKGLVIDKSNMRSLSNISVSLFKSGDLIATTSTNNDGEYRFSNVAGGEYMIRFEHQNYNTFENNLNVNTRDEISVKTVELLGKNSSISGKVMDVNSGLGIANVAVIAGDGNQCFTDLEGNYNISSIIPGFYTISIVAPGFEVQNKNVYIDPNISLREDYFIKQKFGNSRLNLQFFTNYENNILPINYMYVNIIMEKVDTTISKGENGEHFVEVLNATYPISYILEPDGTDSSKVSLVNIYSGYYRLKISAYVPSNSHLKSDKRPAGIYGYIMPSDEMLFISPGIEINMGANLMFGVEDESFETGDEGEGEEEDEGGEEGDEDDE